MYTTTVRLSSELRTAALHESGGKVDAEGNGCVHILVVSRDFYIIKRVLLS